MPTTVPVADRDVLSPGARSYLADLVRVHRPPLADLLRSRRVRQAAVDKGAQLDFLPASREMRAAPWRIAPIPEDLKRRTVEITGPVHRKVVINALNSGADVFMADFEDASAPTHQNMIGGQRNLADAVRRTITFEDVARGRRYRLHDETATLMVRPRGLHLLEKSLTLDGRPVPAALVDFALYMFHNAEELLARGSGPYFYLPKLESHLEARWWNSVFVHAQEALGLPIGTIKATVLIETLPAAFEMDEILYELRNHVVGLNCGRWDYIFSFIKTHRARKGMMLPDRAQVTMAQPFLRAYTQLLVKTCHRRGAYAIGGMAAQIPIEGDDAAAAAALAQVRADKAREVRDGHDGTWVAHPELVPIAREVFAAGMTGTDQLDVTRDDVLVTATDLLTPPVGTRTEAGLRHNVRVGVRYLESWLRGTGCVPIDHLMEDAATAEICRTQIWQWLRNGATLIDGRLVSPGLVRSILEEETRSFNGGRFREARALFAKLCFADQLADFLTLEAYDHLEKTPTRTLENIREAAR